MHTTEARTYSPSQEKMTGSSLPKIPQALIQLFELSGISHRHRHWVAKGRDGYYKLAPQGSTGQRHIRLEGELLQRLDHRHIVKGSLRSQQDWEVLKIDLIQGEPLTKIRNQLTTEEKMQILDEIASAVEYVNREGIIHADVSSDNIIWTGHQSYLIDFEEAIQVVPPISKIDSPDFIGGPPCCWGDKVYGYKTYLCFDSLRAWLLTPEFLDVERDLTRVGVWNPRSIGNTCDPWSTVDNDSVYQTVIFGNETVKGQRDPELRFRHLGTSKQLSFENKRILDIGCNFGRLGAFLNQFGIMQYVGLDLNRDYVNVAMQLADLEGRRNAQFVVGDVCGSDTVDRLNSISPTGYDIVICQSVYHHFVDKKLFWEQFLKLKARWLIFENPIDEPRYLLMNSWQEEKDHIRGLGYETIWESYDNDFLWRILALFEKSSESDHQVLPIGSFC
jgi:SAM-dependent methyltransferase